MANVRVTMKECDNPECRERFEHTTEEPAPGYHIGKGYWVLSGGGPIPATYACSTECITPALEHMIETSC